jgi:predicted RNA binding protein YcfA (HicA-like mRNA interferase family)
MYRRLSILLRAAGYEFLRQGKGSHEIWWHPKTSQTLSIPYNIRNPNTANGILRKAGLPKAF